MNQLLLYRRLTQVAFIALLLLAPSFDLLRYDVAERTLYVLGMQWELGLGQGFYDNPGQYGAGYVAWAFLSHAVLPWVLVLSVFPLLGVFLGRAFCGWACPEGALFEFADMVTLKVLGRRSIYGRKPSDPQAQPHNRALYIVLALVYLLVVPPLFGVMISGYFIAPKRIWAELASGQLSFGLKAGIIGVSAYMFITFIFVRHVICKYLCGAGLMQMLFGWVSPISLAVKFKSDEATRCTDCRKCEEACFMDVKPRLARKDINCVNCGECIRACQQELGQGKELFRFGRNKE